jgi:hypothetical protein
MFVEVSKYRSVLRIRIMKQVKVEGKNEATVS